MTRIEKLEARLARLLELAAMAIMAGLIGVIAYSVFARQVLRISVAWSEEVGSGFLMWMSMLGAAAVWSRRGHIAIDVLLRWVRPRTRYALSLFIELCALTLFAVALSGAVSMMWVSANNHTTALGVSYSYLYLGLVVGLGAMSLFSLLHLARLLRRGPAMVAVIDEEEEWNTSSSS